MPAKSIKSGSRAPRSASASGLSMVVPVFNEAKGLAALHERIAEVARWFKVKRGLPTEVIYVDDGSTDGTDQVAHSLIADPLDIQVVTLSRNFGKEAALLAGLDHARFGAVLFMDGDGQHPPGLIDTLVARWLDDGYDVVYTAKAHRVNEFWLRRAGVHWFYALINLGARQKIPEDAGDFRLLSPRAAAALRQMPERSRFFKGLSSWIGFKQVRVDYEPARRAHGATNWSVWTLIGLSIEGLTSFSVAPLRVASLLGLLLAVTALFFGAEILDRDHPLRQGRARLSLAGGQRDGDRRGATAHDRRARRIHRQAVVRSQGAPGLFRRRTQREERGRFRQGAAGDLARGGVRKKCPRRSAGSGCARTITAFLLRSTPPSAN